jgi:predicted transcriptional regulator
MDSAANFDTATVTSHGRPEASRFAGGEPMGDPTRLEAFMKANKITPMALVRASGISRQYLLRLRMGKSEPRRAIIAAIVAGCRQLSHKTVKPTDLFDLGD